MVRSILRFLLHPRLEKLLRVDPESKPAVYLQVFDGADVQNVNYWLELFLSAGIATLGLVLSSPAVVIGAMLVSPLMGPIIGFGLALAAADLYLGIKSALQLMLSVLGSILFAGLLVWVLPLDTATPEILARTNPKSARPGHCAVFRAGRVAACEPQPQRRQWQRGFAGCSHRRRPDAAALHGGFRARVGFDLHIMGGGSLLFLTNLAAIVASAFFVFSCSGWMIRRFRSGSPNLCSSAPLRTRSTTGSRNAPQSRARSPIWESYAGAF